MSGIMAIARGVLAGANKNRQDEEEREREQRAEAEERRRREFDEGLRSTETLARLAAQGFDFHTDDGDDEDERDVTARFFDPGPSEHPPRGGPPARPTGSGRDDGELEELPALPVVQDHTGTPIYESPSRGSPPRRPMEIASEIVRGERPPRRKPINVGTIVRDGKRVAVSYDPSNSPAGKAARRNRSAYDQLQRAGQIGPDAEFDELEDYAAMLREQQTERRRSERRAGVVETVAAALIAKKIPELQARRLAEIYVKADGSVAAGIGDYLDQEDLDVFARKEEIRASTAARYRAPRERAAPSPTTRESYFRQVAASAIEAADGDVKAAAALLVQDPSTKNVFSEGMAVRHLNAAAAQYRRRAAAERRAARRSGVDDSWSDEDEDDDGGDEREESGDKGEAPDSVVDAALRRFGGDEAKAAAYLRSQGYN